LFPVSLLHGYARRKCGCCRISTPRRPSACPLIKKRFFFLKGVIGLFILTLKNNFFLANQRQAGYEPLSQSAISDKRDLQPLSQSATSVFGLFICTLFLKLLFLANQRQAGFFTSKPISDKRIPPIRHGHCVESCGIM